MSLWKYINYMKEKEKEEMEPKNDKESINQDSTQDEMIEEKLRTFEKLIEKDKKLKFKKGSM